MSTPLATVLPFLPNASRLRPAAPHALSLLAAVIAAIAANPARAQAEPEIVVTAARQAQPLRDVVGDVSVVTEADLRRSGSLSLADVLRTLPAVQMSNNGGFGKPTGISLRGANATQTLLLVDGMRLGSATAGSAAFQNIPLDRIERVEVLRGPAAALYGADAIGGVIQIFTKQGSGSPTPSVSLGVGDRDTRSLSADYRGQAGDTRFAVGVGHFTTGGISAIVNPDAFSYNPDRDGYRSTSASASVSHRFNADHSAGASLLASKGNNHYDGGSVRAFDYYGTTELAALSAWTRNRLAERWVSNLRLSHALDDARDYAPLSAANLVPQEFHFKTGQTQLAWQNELAIGPGTATLGLERLQQKVSGTTPFPVAERTIDAALAGYLARLDAVSLQANLRHDHNSQFGSHTTGLLGAAWQFAPALQVGANASTGFNAPTFNQLYFPGFGNAALKPEKSRNVEAFLRYAEGPLRGGVTAYRNRVTDLIGFGPAFVPLNVGKADLEGVSVNGEWAGAWLALGANLDWMSPRDASGGANDGKLLNRRARQAGTVYAVTRTLPLTLRLELTGQGRRYDDAANTQAMGGYGVVNAAASYPLSRDWSLGVRVDNLLGKRYELAKDYGVIRSGVLFTLAWQPKR